MTTTQADRAACVLLKHGTKQAEGEERMCEQCGVTICAVCAPFELCRQCQEDQASYEAEKDAYYAEYLHEAKEKEYERARERELEQDHIKFWRRGF